MAPTDQAGAISLDAGSVPRTAAEIWERSSRGEPWVRNVTAPTLTPVLPAPGTGNGVAVVVAPGGAFRALSVSNEGMAVARWFAARGIAAFLLKYRVEPTPPATADYVAMIHDFQRRFAAGEVSAADLAVPPEAVADGQAAMRLVRARASEWQIDPAKVGFIGFSAGAMTAVAVASESPPATRPDFIMPIYPAMLPVQVPAGAPPMFLALASDDPLFGSQGYGLVDSWKAAGGAVEFHLFERGGHGFGLRHQDLTSDRWPRLLQEWLHMHGWVAGEAVPEG
jgi:acetyl esterase/lipase